MTRQDIQPWADVIEDSQSSTTSSVALAERVIAAQESWAHLNGFISFNPERLLAEAQSRDAERATGADLGPLHGIPIALKDNINTHDYPTSGGTPSLVGNETSTDAPIAARLRAAGAIIAGKANMHELSAGGASDNHTFGRVGNPYDTGRVPGGSSGGPAALVAAGVVPASIGTDTAGSVRVPAALCGVVGFRPSEGRYPSDGIVPLSLSYDTAGPLAQTVADVVAVDAVLAEDNTALLEPDDITLGVPRTTHFTDVSEDVAMGFEQALDRLRGGGIDIKDVDLTPVNELHKMVPRDVNSRESLVVMRDYLSRYAPHLSFRDLVSQIASANVHGVIAPWLEGEPPDEAFVTLVNETRSQLADGYASFFAEQELDALIFPTTTQPALPLAEDDHVTLNGETVLSWLYFSNTPLRANGRIARNIHPKRNDAKRSAIGN